MQNKVLRVGLLHNTLNVMGGAERFTLDLIAMLHQHGMQVNLATFDKTRWNDVGRMFGSPERPDSEMSLLPFRLRMFGIYQRILMKAMVGRLERKSDVVINTHSDHLFCRTDIVYVHGVTSLGSSSGALGLERYQRSALMKAYFFPYKHLILSRLRPYTDRDGVVFVANSRFTQERMKQIMEIQDSQIIYPAVDTETYSRLAIDRERKNQVVTVGRFTREKNLHLIPEIASRCRSDVSFAVVSASAGSPAAMSALRQEFDNACKKYNVQSRVTLYLDIPFEQKLAILAKSKAYLHLMPAEHFGLALAEGVSAGCLPVVVKGGGQEEIVEGIQHSVYTDLGHAADLVNLATNAWTPTKAQEVSSMMNRFGKDRFVKEFISLIENVAAKKIKPVNS